LRTRRTDSPRITSWRGHDLPLGARSSSIAAARPGGWHAAGAICGGGTRFGLTRCARVCYLLAASGAVTHSGRHAEAEEDSVAKHKQAAKRARQAQKRAARNISIVSRVKNAVRGFRDALAAGDRAAIEAALKKAAQQLQRAASKGVLHKRNAARRVARLMRAKTKPATAATKPA
jgi:small subunit ribosomal protein S20